MGKKTDIAFREPSEVYVNVLMSLFNDKLLQLVNKNRPAGTQKVAIPSRYQLDMLEELAKVAISAEAAAVIEMTDAISAIHQKESYTCIKCEVPYPCATINACTKALHRVLTGWSSPAT